MVGILAGVGAGLGQYLHYYIGLGGRVLLPDRYRQMGDKWKERLRKRGIVLIFVFAATPFTPDDVLWIPLGIMKYLKLRALVTAIAGKILLNTFYAFAGYYGWEFFTKRLDLPFLDLWINHQCV